MANDESRPIRWAEISTRAETERFTALSQAISEAGLPNEVAFIEVSPEDFPAALAQAQTEFDQIRIGGEFRSLAPKLSDRLPSMLLTLRAADAMVREGDEWWLRNYFVEGLQESIAGEIKDIDLTGGVFILGATADARVAAATFVRFGFRRIDISDPDEDVSKTLVEELRSNYFNVQFQSVPRHMITQLPGIHSVAVNTLAVGDDEGMLSELAYFNFLKPGGVWLDLPLVRRNPALEAEARSVGAVVESSASVLARSDLLWVRACFAQKLTSPIDHESLRQRYEGLASSTP